MFAGSWYGGLESGNWQKEGKAGRRSKRQKSKLHQVGGAYFERRVNYKLGLELLRQAAALGDDDFRRQCRELMGFHASTRERLVILDQFYRELLGKLPPIRSVIDVACGFNPLAWPWISSSGSFSKEVSYWAYDIYADMVGFIRGFMDIVGMNGKAEVRDVLSNPPTQPVDLAFILKSLPCLEQLDKTAVPKLLDSLQAKYTVISFPIHSLGGREKGMVQNYEAQFLGWMAGRGWKFSRYEFSSELAFLVETEV